MLSCDFVPHSYETLKRLSSLPTLIAEVILPLPTPPYPLSPFSPSLISLVVSVDVKHHVYLLTYTVNKVQELCESRGGRPGLSVLTSLLVSVDVNRYIEPCFGIGLGLSLICQLTSEDIKQQYLPATVTS